jgi:hypothetical protein
VTGSALTYSGAPRLPRRPEPTLEELFLRLDACSDAVLRALRDASDARAIPNEGDVSDPAFRLAVEATCFAAEWRRLRGKTPRKEYFA